MLGDIQLAFEKLIKDKTVLITGGTGAIGLQLARRVADCSPKMIRLLQHSADLEFSSDDQDFLSRNYERIDRKVGNLLNNDYLDEAVEDVQIAFHAAAETGVGRCEKEPIRAVQLNLERSLALMTRLDHVHCQKGVFISSVRAACPVNVYAMTKNLMERLVSKRPEAQTTFVAVRLGLVVWPIAGNVFNAWLNAASQNDSCKVFDVGKNRFLMSMKSAIDSIIYALMAGNHGDIIVPNMRCSDMESLVKVFTEHHLTEPKYVVKPDEQYPNPSDRILSEDELPFTRERPLKSGMLFYHMNRDEPSSVKAIPITAKNNSSSYEELRQLLCDAGLGQVE
jgi:UDP-N-acetylglucosamine 4,6-dehydratase/5-epimerase